MDASTAPLPLNLVEYEAAAKALLPAGNYGYVAGAAFEPTICNNSGALRRLAKV